MVAFKKILENLNIDPDRYLEIAKSRAYSLGYDPSKLLFSNLSTKKLQYKPPDGPSVHFGASGYKDFIIYSILTPLEASSKRRSYHARASSKCEASDPYSRACLALRILW
jgi:hypothetical protein